MMVNKSGWTRALGLALMFSAASAHAEQGEVPEGYRVAQQVLVGDGSVLEVLEDLRITPQMHADSWGSALDADSFDASADLENHPLLEAQARLIADSGEVLAQKDLGYPLATVEKAPINGLPAPAFFLTIDMTAPMGSYSGPATEVLVPAQNQLDPLRYLAETGEKRPLVLAETGKAAWKVVPANDSATESIQQVSSAPAPQGEDFVTTYRTYRYVDGQWQVASRQQPGYWENESEFPQPSAFP
ncbi:hypothetical protein [Pseudomonas sp. QD4]|uniref:hypothetical protein n=1 Tax=Pseudomonas sp. QD4 TaxID=3368618 RepID=UPI003BA13346